MQSIMAVHVLTSNREWIRHREIAARYFEAEANHVAHGDKERILTMYNLQFIIYNE